MTIILAINSKWLEYLPKWLFEILDELVTLSEKEKKLQFELSRLNTDQAENMAEFQLLCEHFKIRPKGRQIIPNKVAGDVPQAPSAKNISMILCRQPRLDDDTYNQLLEKAKEEGYDVSKLHKTPHSESPPEGDNAPTDSKGIWNWECTRRPWCVNSAQFKCDQTMQWLLGYYAQAISCYNEVLKIDPVDTDGLAKRDNAYIKIDIVDEAMFLHNIGGVSILHSFAAILLSTRASFAPMSAPHKHHFKPHLIPSRVPTPHPTSQGLALASIVSRVPRHHNRHHHRSRARASPSPAVGLEVFLTLSVSTNNPMISSWSERMISHTGTETRPRLLREAAVGNFQRLPLSAGCLGPADILPISKGRKLIDQGLNPQLDKLVRKDLTVDSAESPTSVYLYERSLHPDLDPYPDHPVSSFGSFEVKLEMKHCLFRSFSQKL
ncbi:hypothetical protein FXO37_13981 [Capsicum annuum]|nr:hypothetical protein FXO37_13981 [Capsicum annuum]